MEAKLPKVATLLEGAEDDILAFYAFPIDHWRKLRGTNPLERFNREIGRRTEDVPGRAGRHHPNRLAPSLRSRLSLSYFPRINGWVRRRS